MTSPVHPPFWGEVLQALFVKSDIVFVKVLGEDYEVEFPGPQWLPLASLRLLPTAGYRELHVIVEPTT